MLLGYSFEPRPNSLVQKRVWQERTRLTSPEVRAAATSKVWRNRPFPSSENLTFKVRLSPKPLIWKWFLIMMQIKLIFTRKVSHLASFWKWDLLELENGLFRWSLLFSSSLKKRIGCSVGRVPVHTLSCKCLHRNHEHWYQWRPYEIP